MGRVRTCALVGLLALMFQPGAVRICWAQGRPPAMASAEVQSDNHVTFRLSAPKATDVSIAGDWRVGGSAAQPLEKTSDGLWSVTIGPLTPDVYTYTFVVDGVSMPDPNNRLITTEDSRTASIMLVPGKESDLYAVQDVPHGTISKVWYKSPSLGMTRRMSVYTPPGYEGGTTKYPVLYLISAGWGNEDTWIVSGRACKIIDNLIAARKAVPMIVVMPNVDGTQIALRGEAHRHIERPPVVPGTPRGIPSEDPFIPSLVKDILPFVEANYRVVPDRAHRAIAGWSMGGGQSLFIALNDPDRFGYLGVWSSEAATESMSPANGDRFDSAMKKEFSVFKTNGLRLFYTGCSTDEAAYRNFPSLLEILKANGIPFRSRETTGGHSWRNARIQFSELAPLLFK
jgi:enterochelin esterase-like enzyme